MRLDEGCPLHLVGLGSDCRLQDVVGGAELEGPVVPETGEDGDLQREEREHNTIKQRL